MTRDAYPFCVCWERSQVIYVKLKNPAVQSPLSSDPPRVESGFAGVSLPPSVPVTCREEVEPSRAMTSGVGHGDLVEARQLQLRDLTEEIERRATGNAASEARYEAIYALGLEGFTWGLKTYISCQAALLTFKALNPPVKDPYFLNGPPLAVSLELFAMTFGTFLCSVYLCGQPLLKWWKLRVDSEWEVVMSLIDQEKELESLVGTKESRPHERNDLSAPQE